MELCQVHDLCHLLLFLFDKKMLKIHRDVIVSSLSILVEETDLNTLVPELLNRNVFNERMINRILNTAHTTKRQKTDLYTELLKRGPHAFDNLHAALQVTSHTKLAQMLKDVEMRLKTGDDAVPSSNSADDQGTSNIDGSCISVSGDNEMVASRESESNRNLPSHSNAQGTRDRPQNLGSQPETTSKSLCDVPVVSRRGHLNSKMFQFPWYMKDLERVYELSEFPFTNNVIYSSSEKFLPVKVKSSKNFKGSGNRGPPIYKMDSIPRGYALIVNNIDFDDAVEYKTRYGADNDEHRLKLLFEQLHYVVEVHKNKTKREMLEITDRFSRKDELNECDSVIVTFMSHGEEGDTEENSKIVGVDGFSVAISDILAYFYNDACRALINKPKIFFFQACRGVLEDAGVLLSTYIHPSRIEKDDRNIWFPPMHNRVRSQSDIFIACPVPPGRKANRDRITGTWFIQTIIEIFSEHAWDTHLEDLMKMVDLSIKSTNNFYTSNFQALTTKTIGWNKNLYFNPGLGRHKATGEIIRLGDGNENSSTTEEEKDVTDSPTSDSPQKSCQNSPINIYSKLKEDKDDDSDGDKGKGCYNFLGCNTI